MDKSNEDVLLIENLKEILSILCHELGNPINSLKITLDVLQENYDLFDDVKKKVYLKRTSELLARQEKLIEVMKSYSKFNVKEPKRMEFLPFWENFSNIAINKLEALNIKLTNNFHTGPDHIKADNQALNKILMTVLDNAIEALENVNEPEIEMMVSQKNGLIMILIKDNGPGIRKNDMSKIFIPLFTTKPGKMGMGLPIARKLSLELEGRMEIESVFGNGTEARLWLKTMGNQETKNQNSNKLPGGK